MLTLVGASPGAVLMQAGAGLATLALFLWWLGRRLHGPVSGASERVVRLTPHDALHVVTMDGRRFLVGTGSAGAPRLLCELEAPKETKGREEARRAA